MTLRFSHHAIIRFRERVADLPDAEIIAALTSPALTKAADFGAHYVRLGTNQRVVIEEGVIVTVLPADHFRRQVHRRGLGRYGHADKAHRREQFVTTGGARE